MLEKSLCSMLKTKQNEKDILISKIKLIKDDISRSDNDILASEALSESNLFTTCSFLLAWLRVYFI